MQNKWQYTGNLIEVNGHVVYEIESCINFSVAGTVVKKGQRGGWLENEDNLSQKGNCWVFPNCIVMDHAHVKDSAVLRYGSVARDHALVFGDAIVTEGLVAGYSKIGDHAILTDAALYGNAEMSDHSSLTGKAVFLPLERQAPQEGDTYLAKYARMRDFAQGYNGVAIDDFVIVRGHVKLCGPIEIHGEAMIDKRIEDEQFNELSIDAWMTKLP